MKRLFLLLNCIIGALLVSASTTENVPIRLQPTRPDNPVTRPKSPLQSSVYCILSGDTVLIYSDNSVMAEIVVSDINTNEEVHHDFTDLNEGSSFNIITNHTYKIVVLLANIQYETVIDT